MTWSKPLLTLDTNAAIYAFAGPGLKAEAARTVLERADFVSVRHLNELANAIRRKHGGSWGGVRAALDRIRRAVPKVLPVDESAHIEADRLVEHYHLSFFDALMLGVAMSGGARTFYSEDMQHGMTINETLRIVNPFLSTDKP